MPAIDQRFAVRARLYRIMERILLKYDPVDAFLRDLKGKRVTYVPNPGNAGDSLIASGTYQALRRAGVPFDYAAVEAPFEHEIVIVGGGGNLVPLYAEARRAVERGLELGRRIVILPHTVRGNEDLLARLDPSVTIFCRDPLSYDHVTRHSEARAYLAHDMAFHLDVEEFDHRCAAYTEMPAVFNKILERNPSLAEMMTRRIGVFMRGDGESRQGLTSSFNADISVLFEFGVAPDNAEKSAWGLFRAVRGVEALTTDRLHVGISSTLLKRSCLLHDNSYGKNAGIYHHSIRRTGAAVKLVTA